MKEKRYIIGDSYRDGDYKTYGITDTMSQEDGIKVLHYNKIVVYGDISLRNTIIKLLNDKWLKEKPLE